MLTAAGVWRIDSSVDAICRYTAPKNLALFADMQVLNAEECQARENVMLTQYIGTVEIEVRALYYYSDKLQIILKSVYDSISFNISW